MNVNSTSFKLFLYLLIFIFAFYINYHYANKGLYPIDTFAFFDSGYYITKGLHPIKDFWVISGILADYIQGFFFLIFGFNWNAYIFHASFFNVLISLFFFYFLNQFNNNVLINFLLAISVATLCYPVVGTPFPYQHSFVLSIVSLLFFYLAVSKEKKIFWVVLPIIMLFSFLSMQLPSGIINILIIFFSFIYFVRFNQSYLKHFILGIFFSLLILLIYFLMTKVSFDEFLIQLILFPLTVGQGRIVSEESAFEAAKLINKFTLRGIFGHFKFIHIFLFGNIILLIIHIKKNLKKIEVDKILLLNIFILFCSIGFIFHQLITANQTFIFSLIPILCGLLLIQLDDVRAVKSITHMKFFVLFLIAFVTIKYHLVYNEKRKFMDLQNVNFSKSIKANKLDKRFNNLNWITPSFSEAPEKEINLIKQSIQIIKDDPNKKMLITHYQFFSLLLKDNLNIPNRWYFPNNTFPSSNENKYFDKYRKKFNNIIDQKGIKVIYILETYPDELEFLNLKELIQNQCFEKKKENESLYLVKLKNCN